MSFRNILTYIFIFLPVPAESQNLKVADTVDMVRYAGKWFEIATIPAPFQKGCHCTTTEYEPVSDHFNIVNRCIRFRKGSSKISSARARAFPVKGSRNFLLKVRYRWTVTAYYQIVLLDEDYNWAVITDKKQKYLWILSRDAFMPTHIYNGISGLIKLKGFDVSKLIHTSQNCDITE